MLRTLLVVAHAGAGVGGLLLGLAALRPPANIDSRLRTRRLYAASIAALLASMIALIAVDWRGLETGARTAFVGLAGLGAVMAYRVARAHHEAKAKTPGWQVRYIGHVYFTYVSLWIGFLIVPALSLPLPHVVIPAMVVAVLAVGHILVASYTQRVIAA